MCGVIGIFGSPTRDVFPEAAHGLFQMQHRGQEACGLAISDGRRIRLHKDIGYVRRVFAARPTDDFAGHVACGHVRYPTQGTNRIRNAQPHLLTTLEGTVLALASNGDLTNYHAVRATLEQKGVDFVGTNDAELLLNVIAYGHLREGLSLVEAIREMQRVVHGAYSAALITRDRLFAIRDPFALRPLCFGGDHKLWVVASETNALDTNQVDLIDEVEPGEIIEIDAQGVHRHPHPDPVGARNGREHAAHCVFEHVYFSRPDSIAFGQRVYDVRKRIGAWLAADDPIVGDVVVPVPDSSNAMALGYAQKSVISFEFALIRNHYVGRTFISPDQALRDDGVRRKFNPIRSLFKDKRVILVDDSIVRGTTLRKIVRMVRSQGAAEIHLRIGSPVTRHSCFYGVDTPTSDELIGAALDVDGIREHITADTLRYISLDGLSECVGDVGNYCRACFDGSYPVPVTESKRSE